MHSTFPAHLNVLDLISLVKFFEEYKLGNFRQSFVISFYFRRNILVITVCSDAFSLYSFRNIRDQMKCPYKTAASAVTMSLHHTVRPALFCSAASPESSSLFKWQFISGQTGFEAFYSKHKFCRFEIQ